MSGKIFLGCNCNDSGKKYLGKYWGPKRRICYYWREPGEFVKDGYSYSGVENIEIVGEEELYMFDDFSCNYIIYNLK